jgi:predicted metal-dependent HD superfamily phosphohydrolase
MQTQNELQDRWNRLCERLHVEGELAQATFQELVARYSEPHRAYHTLTHIQECLKQFDVLHDHSPNPFAIELAIWFHDVVYSVRRKRNEEESAIKMVSFATIANIDPKTIEVATNCIQASKHNHPPQTHSEQVMIDVDLAILGQPWPQYELYTQQIRKEYAHVPQIIYVLNRRHVIKRFVEYRLYIYFTPHMREHHEAQARANIARELHSLMLL